MLIVKEQLSNDIVAMTVVACKKLLPNLATFSLQDMAMRFCSDISCKESTWAMLPHLVSTLLYYGGNCILSVSHSANRHSHPMCHTISCPLQGPFYIMVKERKDTKTPKKTRRPKSLPLTPTPTNPLSPKPPPSLSPLILDDHPAVEILVTYLSVKLIRNPQEVV